MSGANEGQSKIRSSVLIEKAALVALVALKSIRYSSTNLFCFGVSLGFFIGFVPLLK